jgi:TonB family protein
MNTKLRRLPGMVSQDNVGISGVSSIAFATLLLYLVVSVSCATNNTASYAPQVPDVLFGELPMPTEYPGGNPDTWSRQTGEMFWAGTVSYREAWAQYIAANNIAARSPTPEEFAEHLTPPDPPAGSPESWSGSQRRDYATVMSEYAETIHNQAVNAEATYKNGLQALLLQYESTPGRELHAEICRRLQNRGRVTYGKPPAPNRKPTSLSPDILTITPPPETYKPPYYTWLADAKPILLNSAEPEYHEAALTAGLKGHVFVEIVVDNLGLVTETRVERGAAIFHQAAVKAARQLRFVPDLKDGEAVPVRFSQQISFRLAEGSDGTGQLD